MSGKCEFVIGERRDQITFMGRKVVSRTIVLHLGCTLESPSKFQKYLMSSTHPFL